MKTKFLDKELSISKEDIERYRTVISKETGIPKEWLWFDVGTEQDFGTIIPSKYMNNHKSNDFRVFIKNKVFNIKDYKLIE